MKINKIEKWTFIKSPRVLNKFHLSLKVDLHRCGTEYSLVYNHQNSINEKSEKIIIFQEQRDNIYRITQPFFLE